MNYQQIINLETVSFVSNSSHKNLAVGNTDTNGKKTNFISDGTNRGIIYDTYFNPVLTNAVYADYITFNGAITTVALTNHTVLSSYAQCVQFNFPASNSSMTTFKLTLDTFKVTVGYNSVVPQPASITLQFILADEIGTQNPQPTGNYGIFSFTYTTPTVLGNTVVYTSTSSVELNYYNSKATTGIVSLWVASIANATTIPCGLTALAFTGLLTGTTDTDVAVTVTSF